jgi:hypothetical protein
MASNFVTPWLTAFTSAVLSAQIAGEYAPFSTFAPIKIVFRHVFTKRMFIYLPVNTSPLTDLKAAPTAKFE